ncbi:hypothetical protein ABZS93_27440 [Streptomyces sp900116325]|uniref:hypothetical protein n=1 Tax=Streptomyces sp. 900116325 TaxID=3154295 RepID=UPI0033B97361
MEPSHDSIRSWLVKHSRFELHFTPTGSSWINQVERWFGYLAHQVIRCGAHKNIQALEADIRAWVKDWNEDPKPFIWTKTAEEILDPLARFCRRISGAGHQKGLAARTHCRPGPKPDHVLERRGFDGWPLHASPPEGLRRGGWRPR